jgi:arsenite-transporting ATPase
LTTGKGGVGKTTVSAASAVRAAALGIRTLVVSTDAAHSLADVFETELGPDVCPIAENLDGVHLDGQREIERSWGAIADYLRRLLGETGIDHLHAEELLAIPGLDQLLALVRLRELVQADRWDVVIIDCAPSADNLRLLALPDAVSFYLTRLFGRTGTVGIWARRRFERAFGVPTPNEEVIESVGDLIDEVSRVRSMFAAATTTARIVVNPERIVIAEGQRLMSYLALYGYPVDAVVVNRVITSHAGDTVLQGWIESQRANLVRIGEAFGGLPMLTVSFQAAEPLGMDALRAVADELYRDRQPLDVMAEVPALSITTDREEAVLRVPVGGAGRDELDVLRRDGELLISLDGHRRAVRLPDSLLHQEVRRAGVADGCLEIAFGSNGDGR